MKLFVFILLFFVFITGCSETKNQDFTLIVADNPNVEGYQPWVFDWVDTTLWFREKILLTGSSPDFSPWLDDYYFVMDYDNAVDAIKLFTQTVWKFKYRNQKRDCDDFAFAFKSWIQFLFADTHNVNAAAPVAILFVDQKYSFGGVKGGENITHSLIGIATNKGVLIVEPLNGEYSLLEDYPNKSHIFYIIR
jgi:hypothetical protein